MQKFALTLRASSGPYQLCLPGILGIIILQQKEAIPCLHLKAEFAGDQPLRHDLAHFEPHFPPAETPGALMEPKPGVGLNLTTHRSAAGKTDLRNNRPWPEVDPDFGPSARGLVAGRKPVAIVTRVIYNGNESLT
jgi:hypothetical protein